MRGESKLKRLARPVRNGCLGSALLCVMAATPSAQVAPADTSSPATVIRGDTALPTTLAGSSDSVVFLSGADTPAGRAIARVLASTHQVLDGGGRPVNLPRGTSFGTSLVILSPRVTIGARVAGDVVVVGGDLFTHPGGRIESDAVAVGGGVYHSTLANIGGSSYSFRDETFEIARAPGQVNLTHRESLAEYAPQVVSLPLRLGIRVPSYNRVDGVVLPWGPTITLGRGAITIDPTVTYRSHIGEFDPAVRAVISLGTLVVVADARRATFSNDSWIRSDGTNSLATIWSGRDMRNHFRADRIDLQLGPRWETATLVVEPYLGARNELGWSAGEGLSRDSHPWSLRGRDSTDGIFRPNPAVLRGRIRSGLAGVALRWSGGDVRARFSAAFEQAWDSPAESSSPGEDGEFTQLTLHGNVTFPTFAGQRLISRAHAVTSSSDDERPPPQRYAYLGGSGTLATMDLLSQGGTELFFFEANYVIPIPIIQLPFVGPPTLSLRYMTGAAGIDELPKFTQNIGARLGVRFIAVQFLMDPATKEKHWGVGLTLTL
ncbi:MAG TPA: hypothetical protein VMM17_00500 [Gemmatimonadaceae bacterium]|nr:hypothetical protein [Gemmatimonadaceae bacterium]